jgi:hypothetical protein
MVARVGLCSKFRNFWPETELCAVWMLSSRVVVGRKV